MNTEVIIRALVACGALALAATGYDWIISALDKAGYLDGYVSLAVAAGCSATLATALWVCWPLGVAARVAVAITFGLFVPAGVPMIIGSIRRHVTKRVVEQRRIDAEADIKGR